MANKEMNAKYYKLFVQSQAWMFAILAIATALFTLIPLNASNTAYNNKNNHRNRMIAQNLFWNILAGNQPTSGTPYGQLAVDLRPFLQPLHIVGGPTSPLIPRTVADLSFTSGNYPDVVENLELTVFTGEPYPDASGRIQTCVDCGKLSPEFLVDFDKVQHGKVAELIQPVPPIPSYFIQITLFKMPVWLWVILLFIVESWIGFLAGYVIVNDEALHYGYHWTLARNGDERDKWKIIMEIFCPVPLAFNELRELQAKHSAKKKVKLDAKTAKAAADKALKDNPVAEELYSATNRLNVLLSFSADARDDPNVQKAIKDTKELISELERFPTVVSKRAAQLLAENISRENADARLRPKSILEAQEEASKL